MSFDPELLRAMREGKGIPAPGQPPQIGPTLIQNQQTGEKWLAPTVAVATLHADAMNQLAQFMSMRDDLAKTFACAIVVRQRNLRHIKKNFRAGERSTLEIQNDLIEEVGELGEALVDFSVAKPAGQSSLRGKVLSEMADVFNVLYALAAALGFSLQEINVRGLEKLEERFTDAPSEEEMLVRGGEAPA